VTGLEAANAVMDALHGEGNGAYQLRMWIVSSWH
jgi:hypothetical protein